MKIGLHSCMEAAYNYIYLIFKRIHDEMKVSHEIHRSA